MTSLILIEKYTNILYDNIATIMENKNTLFLPNDDFYNLNNSDILQIQFMASIIIKKLGLRRGKALVSYLSTLDSAGKVEISNNEDYLIEINSEYKNNLFAVGAILAHELMHIFLQKNGLWLNDTRDNEIITDFSSIYLGFGILILNGQQEFINEKQIKTSFLGYLRPTEFAHLFCRYLDHINHPPDKEIIKHLSQTGKEYFYRGKDLYKEEQKMFKKSLLTIKKIKRRHQFINEHLYKYLNKSKTFSKSNVSIKAEYLVKCKFCFKLYKIPNVNSHIKIKCKRCTENFDAFLN